MADDTKRGKATYVGPLWKKLDFKSGELKTDMKLLHALGRELVDCVVEEAKKDFAKRKKSGRGKPVPDGGGIGPDPSFFKSFSYKIIGERTVELRSSSPHFNALMEGRPEGKMESLVAEKNPKLWRVSKSGKGMVRKSIPIIDHGKVLFRQVPLTLDNAWIHPGIAKHTFVNRGIDKYKKRAAAVIAAWLQEKA
jgi:hypothetical protein